MLSELNILRGKKIVNIEYQLRRPYVALKTDAGELIILEAKNDGEDEYTKSLIYFTNFNRFDVSLLQIREFGSITINAVKIYDNGRFTRDYVIYTDRGHMGFSIVNHREGGNHFFCQSTVYEEKKTPRLLIRVGQYGGTMSATYVYRPDVFEKMTAPEMSQRNAEKRVRRSKAPAGGKGLNKFFCWVEDAETGDFLGMVRKVCLVKEGSR